MKTHKSINLVLSDSSAPQSQTLPDLVVSSASPVPSQVHTPTLLCSTAADITSSDITPVVAADLQPEPVTTATVAGVAGFTCDLCLTTTKTKSALIQHRV